MIGSEDDARTFVESRCEPGGMDILSELVALLRQENLRQNLVSAPSLDQVWTRHIADAAQLVDHVSRGTGTWIDLGSGAGFPGLVIAILQPERTVYLVESRKRRIEWLEGAAGALGLSNARVLGQRLETIDPFAVDVISARAFAPLPKLIELALPFSTRATQWVLPKGRSAAQEVAGLPHRLARLFHVKQSATDADAGIVVGTGVEAARL